MSWASDKSEQPYDYTREIHEAEDDAVRKGRPVTRMDDALERGYVKGDES